jgi:hypothetical protein
METTTKTTGNTLAINFVALTILAVITVVTFLPTLTSPPMLDEIYLAGFYRQYSLSLNPFEGFPGLDQRDFNFQLGNALTWLLCLLTASKISILKLVMVLLHYLNALITFFLSEKFFQNSLKSHTLSKLLAFSCALFFAGSPLAPEAVSSLNGLAQLLSSTILLSGLLLTGASSRPLSLLGACLLPIAAFGTLHSASACFTATLFLIVSAGDKKKLCFLVLPGMLVSLLSLACISPQIGKLAPHPVLAALSQREVDSFGIDKNVFINVVKNATTLSAPINKRIVPDRYKKLFRNLAVIAGIALPFVLFSLVTSTAYRMLFLTVTSFWLVSLLGLFPIRIDSDNLYGCRWYYPSLFFTALQMATVTCAPAFAPFNQIKNSLLANLCTGIAALLFPFIFLIQLAPLTYTQALSFKANGNLWNTISKSLEMISGRENKDYVIARDLPESLSLAPCISPFHLYRLDARSTLPTNFTLPPAKLRAYLQNDTHKNLCLHFEKHYGGLVRSDFLPPQSTEFAQLMDAEKIKDRLQPPIYYYNGAINMDKATNCLVLESNSLGGLGLPIECYGLSPLDAQYIFVEAKIDAATKPGQTVDFNWLTNWQTDWESRDRKLRQPATCGDNQFHRYVFPLNNTAWTTNGYPTRLMLGFPAGARVFIRSLGQLPAANSKPSMTAQVDGQSEEKQTYQAFTYKHPLQDEELGLYYLGNKNAKLKLSLNSDSQPTADAQTQLALEISEADKPFKIDNNHELAARSNLKTLPATTSIQEIALTSADFPWPDKATTHVFALRPVLLDNLGKLTGIAGDSIQCLVRR